MQRFSMRFPGNGWALWRAEMGAMVHDAGFGQWSWRDRVHRTGPMIFDMAFSQWKGVFRVLGNFQGGFFSTRYHRTQ